MISLGTPVVSNTSGTLTEAVKVYYQDGAPKDLTERPHPGYALLPKKLWEGGGPWTIVVKTGNTHGKSKNFATGQANVGNFTAKQFQVTRVHDYVFANVAGETILATRRDAAAFFNVLTEEIDSAFTTIGNVMAAEFYRAGTGALATVGSITAKVVTLTSPADIRHFEVGQYLDLWDVDGPAVRSDTGGQNKVAAVDLDNGTFTFVGDPTADWSTLWTPVAGDSIAYMGDLSATFANTQGLAGLEAWNPLTLGSTLFGVAQSDAKLGGSRYSAVTNTQTYREAITDFCAYHQRGNGQFNYMSMHPENWSEYEKELDTKVEIMEGPSNTFGFRMLVHRAPWGDVKIFADPDCPFGVARGIDYNSMCLRTLDQVGPMILDYDGLQNLRNATTDGMEVRIGYYGNIGVLKPNNFGRLVLPA